MLEILHHARQLYLGINSYGSCKHELNSNRPFTGWCKISSIHNLRNKVDWNWNFGSSLSLPLVKLVGLHLDSDITTSKIDNHLSIQIKHDICNMSSSENSAGLYIYMLLPCNRSNSAAVTWCRLSLHHLAAEGGLLYIEWVAHQLTEHQIPKKEVGDGLPHNACSLQLSFWSWPPSPLELSPQPFSFCPDLCLQPYPSHWHWIQKPGGSRGDLRTNPQPHPHPCPFLSHGRVRVRVRVRDHGQSQPSALPRPSSPEIAFRYGKEKFILCWVIHSCLNKKPIQPSDMASCSWRIFGLKSTSWKESWLSTPFRSGGCATSGALSLLADT